MKPPRVLIAIMGLDQHEVGAMAAARILRDAGMEVIYSGRFNMPPSVARTAVDEDVDIIGLSCHSWEYLYYVDELLDLLRAEGSDIPVVVGGSVVTPADEQDLVSRGVAACFGPTSTPDGMVAAIQGLAEERKAGAEA